MISGDERGRPHGTVALSWVARGKTNLEIAELLWLAPSTVRKHLENIYAKVEAGVGWIAILP